MARLTSVSATLVPGIRLLWAHPAPASARVDAKSTQVKDLMKLGYHLASFVPPAKSPPIRGRGAAPERAETSRPGRGPRPCQNGKRSTAQEAIDVPLLPGVGALVLGEGLLLGHELG